MCTYSYLGCWNKESAACIIYHSLRGVCARDVTLDFSGKRKYLGETTFAGRGWARTAFFFLSTPTCTCRRKSIKTLSSSTCARVEENDDGNRDRILYIIIYNDIHYTHTHCTYIYIFT